MIEDEEMGADDWIVLPETEKMLRDRIAELEIELADWHSGKRYMGGTGLQPGDCYSVHLRELGSVLGKTTGYSSPGTCYPIADVKALVDRVSELEELHELDAIDQEERTQMLAALKEADELARFIHDNPPTILTGNYGYPMVDPRYQGLVARYQAQRDKVKT
jgi:hypothetical protein